MAAVIRTLHGDIRMCDDTSLGTRLRHQESMAFLLRIFSILLTFVLSTRGQQCPVSVPTISQSSDPCLLSYTCTNDLAALSWSSDLFNADINIQAGSPVTLPSVTVSGVTLMVTDNNSTSCLSSTLTLTGNLPALHGRTLSCSFPGDPTDTVTIAVPTAPDAPTLMDVSTTCGINGNQVALQWTPPTNTGGQGVVITHYSITGLPQSASCSTGPCDMIDSTATTITGLQCSDDGYMISVRAVNCRGISSSLQVPINLSPPGVPSFSDTGMVNCIDNDTLTLDWTAPIVQSDCDSSLSYNLIVSDTDSVMTADTNARVAVDGSDNYIVTIFASNGCPGLAKEIVISTTCVTPSSTAPPSGVSSSTPIPVIPSSSACPIDECPVPTDAIGIGPIVGGAADGVIVAVLSVLIGFILVCVCCPCLACCLLCRKKACGCCPGICCGPYRNDDVYPHVEKKPVKDQTGQPSYQDPSPIQRQAAPSGDLYAQPEKPARHQKPAAVEMPTYQDPNTIQRQAAPTGDLYAQPDKTPKQVDKPQPSGLVYADLSHSEAPPNVRRRAPVPDTFYAEVRESRP